MNKSWLLTFYSRLTNVFHNSFVLRDDKKGRPNILFRMEERPPSMHNLTLPAIILLSVNRSFPNK